MGEDDCLLVDEGGNFSSCNKPVAPYYYTQNQSIGYSSLNIETCGNLSSTFHYPSTSGITGKVDVKRNAPDETSSYTPSAPPVTDLDDENVHQTAKWTSNVDRTTRFSGGVNEHKELNHSDGVRKPEYMGCTESQMKRIGTYEQTGPTTHEGDEPRRLSRAARRRMQKVNTGIHSLSL